MKRSGFFFWTIILLGFLTACKQSTNNKQAITESAYSKYINSYTSGAVSCKAPIRISFNEEAKSPKQPGEIVSEKLIKLDPAVQGEIKWLDKHTLAFFPSEKMISNTKYAVTVELEKILDVPEKHHTFQFAIKTIKQSFSVNDLTVKPYQDMGLNYQFLSGKVQTADYATNEQVEEVVKVSKDKQTLQLSWRFQKTSKLSN